MSLDDEFSHNVEMLLSIKSKSDFHLIVSQTNSNLLKGLISTENLRVLELLHRILKSNIKILASVLIAYLQTIDKMGLKPEYDLLPYLKKSKFSKNEDIFIIYLFMNELLSVDFDDILMLERPLLRVILTKYHRLLSKSNEDKQSKWFYDLLVSDPVLAIELNLIFKDDRLLPILHNTVAKILELSSLLNVGTKVILEIMAKKTNDDEIIEEIASNGNLYNLNESADLNLKVFLQEHSVDVEPQLNPKDKKDLQLKILNSTYDDEDEYDDSFDDIISKEDSDPVQSQRDQLLIELFISSPQVFHKSNRKSVARLELKTTTNMSDEQLEGWYLMLNRNKDKERIIEKYEWDRISKKSNSAPTNTIIDSNSSAPNAKTNSKSFRGKSWGRGKRGGKAPRPR